MTCYHPMQGYRSRTLTANGKRKIVFNVSEGYADRKVTIPCGQCTGCRFERSRQWAIRCSHEAQLHEENSFITLTYNNANLPANGSLDIRHQQLFFKRLREAIAPTRIKFYACGEYGDKNLRPHYHACVFNYDFPDKRIHQVRDNIPLYTSEKLAKLWPMGFSTIGEVTFESAAYVARYCLKKQTGVNAVHHYHRMNVHPITGEILDEWQIAPEYSTQSNGIGKAWLEKFTSDVYPGDFIVLRGKKMRPPKYYDRIYELTHEEEYRRIRSSRIVSSKSHEHDQTPDRLKVRETVQQARAIRLPRNLEEQL